MIQTIQYPEDNGKQFEMFRYPAGEVQVRLLEPFPTDDDIHVVARIRDGEVMGLAALTDALNGIIPADKTLILPYLPYSRADREFVTGDCGGLRAFSDLINSLGYERVVTLDVHSEVANQNIMNLINVSPRPIIDSLLNNFIPEKSVGVLIPDEGANRYNIYTTLHASKKRDPVSGKLSGFSVPPKESFDGYEAILIVDDICDGGGTFVGIAEQLKSRINLPLYLYVTHGIFSKGYAELLKHFKTVYTTDSFHQYICSHNQVVTFPCMDTILADILKFSIGESA